MPVPVLPVLADLVLSRQPMLGHQRVLSHQ
jgi:hypothetical protein